MKQTLWTLFSTGLCTTGLAAFVGAAPSAAGSCDPLAPGVSAGTTVQEPCAQEEARAGDVAALRRQAEELAALAAREGQAAAQRAVRQMIESGELRRITDSALREARHAALAFADEHELEPGREPPLGALVGQFARGVVEEVLAGLNHAPARAQLERAIAEEHLHEHGVHDAHPGPDELAQLHSGAQVEREHEHERRELERARRELERERRVLEQRLEELERKLHRQPDLRQVPDPAPAPAPTRLRTGSAVGSGHKIYFLDGEGDAAYVGLSTDADGDGDGAQRVFRIERKDGAYNIQHDGVSIDHGPGRVVSVRTHTPDELDDDERVVLIETDANGVIRLVDGAGRVVVGDGEAKVHAVTGPSKIVTRTRTARAPRLSSPPLPAAPARLTARVGAPVDGDAVGTDVAARIRELMNEMRAEMDSLRTDMRDLRTEMQGMQRREGPQ